MIGEKSLMSPESNVKKKKNSRVSLSSTKDNGEESVTLIKIDDNKEVTKTLEKISNGYLLTTTSYSYDISGYNKTIEKFYLENLLEDKYTSEFVSYSWKILDLK